MNQLDSNLQARPLSGCRQLCFRNIGCFFGKSGSAPLKTLSESAHKRYLYWLLSLLGLLLFSNQAYSQCGPPYPTWENYGTGEDGPVSNSILPYTIDYNVDGCRAQVTAITTVGCNTVLTIANEQDNSGSSHRWDPALRTPSGYQTKAIIVDFNMAPGTRNYDLAKIQSVTYSWSYPTIYQITLDRVIPNIATTGSALLTEIVLIPEFTSAYLSYPGYDYQTLKMTCSPWDSTKGIGGIVCFFCEDTLYEYGGLGGQVCADYCGWPAYYHGGGSIGLPATDIAGTPGAGGHGAGYSNHDATNASLTPWPNGTYLNINDIDYGDNIAGNCSGSHYGGNGGYGALSNLGSGPYPGKPGTGYPPADWNTLYIGMGNSSAGGYGGQGAGAGGYGGGGGGAYVDGQSASLTSPSICEFGSGASGGSGGMGARGGGFIYVHAENIDIDAANPYVFSANGDGYITLPGHLYYEMEGSPAVPIYDSAGTGGDGGNGANMYVSGSTVYPAGGGGVEGCQGNGADGGRGAKGGNAGFVWLVYYNYNNATNSNITSVGGPGSHGGAGSPMGRKGHHGTHGTETSLCPPTFDTSYCHPVFGTTTSKGDTFCSCFNAYRVLAMMNHYTTSGSTFNYTNTLDTSIKAYKNPYLVFGEIEHTVTTATCSQHGYILDSLFKCPTSCPSTFFNYCSSENGTVDTSGTPKGIGWGGAITNYDYGFVTKDAVVIDPNISVSWLDTLYTDNTKSTIICPGGCVFTISGTGNADSAGTPRNGFNYTDTLGNGSNSTGEIHQDLVLEVNTQPYAPIAVHNHSNKALNDSFGMMANLLLMNTSSSGIINVDFNADGTSPYYITVTDMLGRQWYTKTLNVPLGSNSIDFGINGWKPGSYILTLWHSGFSTKKVFVIVGQ